MVEIRMHGRGGQGAVVACKILATAFFWEGQFAQSFPSFGVERRGAPVMAFIRVDEKPIRLRTEIYEPDHLVVLDPTLLNMVNVTHGLKPGGTITINSAYPPEHFQLGSDFRVATVDAGHIAVKHGLGTPSQPLVNTAILGAFARVLGMPSLKAVEDAIRQIVPLKPDENVAATREAYEQVKLPAADQGAEVEHE